MKQPVNELADIWISELSTMSSLTHAFMVDGNSRQKEKEREPLSKSFYLHKLTFRAYSLVKIVHSLYGRTFRKGCPFVLSLRATDDGKGLQVTQFHDNHNHEISQVANYKLQNIS